MSSSTAEEAPVYVLVWTSQPGEKGRRHMAIFIPNPVDKNTDVHETCLGVLLHVQGSPLTGFEHNIKRNWSLDKADTPITAHLACHIGAQYVPDPPLSGYEDDSKPNGPLEQLALTVRPPRVSSPLWDANAIFDCQDWVLDYFTRLVQKRIAEEAVLADIHALQEAKVPLIAPPGSGPSTAALPLTASTVRVSQSTLGRLTKPEVPEITRGVYSNAEWDTERKVFRRYDRAAQCWEYRSDSAWKPET